MVNIIQANDTQKRLANHFFKRNKQPQAGKLDIVLIALSDQSIIGGVRLEPIEEAFWLRNLFVIPDQRRKKIGSQLVKSCCQFSTKAVYLFPLPHLNTYYSKLGFEETKAENLPLPLQQKLQQYQAKGKAFIPMGRTINKH